MDPFITFKDDPLRVLRCLRFKSRFNFKVDEKIYETIGKEEIK
jgi:tRNA nucleotidyltransferase (CCA-adding enzyme)